MSDLPQRLRDCVLSVWDDQGRVELISDDDWQKEVIGSARDAADDAVVAVLRELSQHPEINRYWIADLADEVEKGGQGG